MLKTIKWIVAHPRAAFNILRAVCEFDEHMDDVAGGLIDALVIPVHVDAGNTSDVDKDRLKRMN